VIGVISFESKFFRVAKEGTAEGEKEKRKKKKKGEPGYFTPASCQSTLEGIKKTIRIGGGGGGGRKRGRKDQPIFVVSFPHTRKLFTRK